MDIVAIIHVFEVISGLNIRRTDNICERDRLLSLQFLLCYRFSCHPDDTYPWFIFPFRSIIANNIPFIVITLSIEHLIPPIRWVFTQNLDFFRRSIHNPEVFHIKFIDIRKICHPFSIKCWFMALSCDDILLISLTNERILQ